MSKSSNFFGQPIYGQQIKSLNREKIVEFSRKHGGEKYVKSFDGYTHLLTMLYAVIQRFDSLREIETSMTAEVRKLHHVGIDTVPKRSTLSDANARRSEKFFEDVYRDLYAANKDILSSDSRRNGMTTCFVRKGPKPKDEDADISTARRIIGTLRSTAMEGSFGNQKQHYSVGRIAARNSHSETLLLFFGIHMANAATLAARQLAIEEKEKQLQKQLA